MENTHNGEKQMKPGDVSVNIGSTYKKIQILSFYTVLDVTDLAKEPFHATVPTQVQQDFCYW
jgi:hypothetical protein